MYQKSKRQAKLKLLSTFLFVLIISILILFIFTFGKQFILEGHSSTNSQYEKLQSVTSGDGTDSKTDSNEKALKEKAKEIYRKNKKLLVLVNKEHKLKEEDMQKLQSICSGRLYAATIMHPDLCAMLKAACQDDCQYWIASAYRSIETQQGLVDEDVKASKEQGMSEEDAVAETFSETMPAGCSEHQTGLALDILASSNTNMNQTQEQTTENKWLQEHCYEYGFILRYPSDKKEITEINYEPWHFRYVGKEAAKFITENHLTLEEFYDLLDE